MSNAANHAANEIDPRSKQVGLVYARGLLNAAQAAGQLDAIVVEFASFVQEVLDRQPRFEHLLGSALVSPENKVAVLDRVLTGRASDIFGKFLKVVARHGRLSELRAMLVAAREVRNEMRGVVPVEVRTAAPLADGLLARAAAAMSNLVKGQAEIHHQVDPELIGGLVVRVGDTVYDGSLAAQLERVRRQMINRSVHEIQSRRDRFRHPEGN
ncbi:MAG: ATP synthase F1 subunit delta [Pirellulales bacterium]|nr:ATP synthase F1 subunit delta [Pirellulales bacterium]